MSTHWLSSRGTDYLVHVAGSLRPSTSCNAHGKGLFPVCGKPAKIYFLSKQGGTGARSSETRCTLITLRAPGFIFSVFDPSASNPISYQPIWRQSNWQPPFICRHFNLAARSLHSRGPAAPPLASFPLGNTSREPFDSFRFLCHKTLTY